MRTPTFSWSMLRVVGNAPLMRLTVIAPFLPYILAVLDYLLMSGLGRGQVRLEAASWAEEASVSLHLFYFGGTILGVASGLYMVACPAIVSKYADAIEYAEREGLGAVGVVAGSPVHQRLKSQYAELDLSRKFLRITVAILYFVGFLLVLIPPVQRFFVTLYYFTQRTLAGLWF